MFAAGLETSASMVMAFAQLFDRPDHIVVSGRGLGVLDDDDRSFARCKLDSIMTTLTTPGASD